MNIFVANLNFRVESEDLRGVFEEYGEVTSAKVIIDKLTGKSKGFGFVEMTDDEAAKKAITNLDGADFDGRIIVVKTANPSESKPKQSGGYGAGRTGHGYDR